MKKLILAAAVSAALTAFASQASADIMGLYAQGDWNDELIYKSWSVNLLFDTANAVETSWVDPAGAQGHQLTVSNVISGSITLVGYKTWEGWLGNFDTFTPIPDQTVQMGGTTIYQSANAFVASTPLGYVGSSYLSPNTLLPGILPFDQGISAGHFYNYLVGGGSFGPLGSNGQEWTNSISLVDLGPSPVPEPATWATMIFGMFLVGLIVRRRSLLAA